MTYIVYPAATISLPGRNTSEIVPFEPGACPTIIQHTGWVVDKKVTHDLIDTKDGPNVHTSVDVATTVEWIEDDAVLALISVFNDNCFF